MVPAEDDIDILRKLASNKEITLIYEEPEGGKKIIWDKKMKVVPKPIEIAPVEFENIKKEFPKLKLN
jgi:reverse gyrase